MQNEIEHQVLQREFFFSFKISDERDLVTKREEGRDNKAIYFFLMSCLCGWFRLTDSNL